MSAPLISLVAGTTYAFEVEWSTEDAGRTAPVDLTGATARFVIASSERPLVELRDGDGITIAPATGTLAIRIPPVATAGHDPLDWRGARYELRVTLGRDVYSLMIGVARLLDGVIEEDIEEEIGGASA
ncbi:hypothetical protein [Salinicola sp. RZ23]|uniref:hypothetical protein n=1 Tax=Salinicola sp. RZ23 TaxID=1949087 RepID=UPI000DA25A28|nr:hypothetical protein [Salinicola sp. RZ23]